MKRAVRYAALGGLLAGIVLGGGTFVFGEIPIVIHWGGLMIDLGADDLLAVLLIVPFALAGALAGVFVAYIVSFSNRELNRFSGSQALAFQHYRLPILWLTLIGAFAAVPLSRGLPVPPGLYPHIVNSQVMLQGRRAVTEPQDPWQAIETLQLAVLADRNDSLTDRLQQLAIRAFFASLSLIHAVALMILGGTLACWSALVGATYRISRRAGGEAIFWSLWLLAGGFFAGLVAIGGFGYAFGGLGPRTPAVLYIYSIVNTGIPAAWITLAAAAGNTLFGLQNLSVRRRSILAGLFAAANAGAVLLLGTTTRLALTLRAPIAPDRGSGIELPPAWQILTYFEGHLVAPWMGMAPAAPMATLGVIIGVALGFGGAFYGINLRNAEQTTHPSSAASASL